MLRSPKMEGVAIACRKHFSDVQERNRDLLENARFMGLWRAATLHSFAAPSSKFNRRMVRQSRMVVALTFVSSPEDAVAGASIPAALLLQKRTDHTSSTIQADAKLPQPGARSVLPMVWVETGGHFRSNFPRISRLETRAAPRRPLSWGASRAFFQRREFQRNCWRRTESWPNPSQVQIPWNSEECREFRRP